MSNGKVGRHNGRTQDRTLERQRKSNGHRMEVQRKSNESRTDVKQKSNQSQMDVEWKSDENPTNVEGIEVSRHSYDGNTIAMVTL